MKRNYVKICSIASDKKAKKKLRDRYYNAKRDRRRFEEEWNSNELALYDVGTEGSELRYGDSEPLVSGDTDMEAAQEKDAFFLGINPIIRNKALLHSQLCSNPPVCTAAPRSSEPKDMDAAVSAEMVLSYGRKRYNLIDSIALVTNNTFDYGTGFLKNIYEATAGEILDTSEEGYLIMSGDSQFTVPRVWDIFVDPNARKWDEVRYLFERLEMPLDEAIEKFGEKYREKLEQQVRDNISTSTDDTGEGASDSALFNTKYNVVPILEYWETGLPENGYQGVHGFCLTDGSILGDLHPSPCAFKEDGFRDQEYAPKKARLPYSVFTYMDLQNTVWGRTPVAHTARSQDVLNDLIGNILSTCANMGSPHLVYEKGSINEDDLKNFSGIPIGVKPGAGGSYTLQAANTSGDTKIAYENIKQYIDDAWGVNDAMFGKQQRETSGTAMQLATIQGNLIRQRLFDKYVLFVEDVYRLFLQYVVEYWKTPRMISVTGEENTVNTLALKGSDIASGYDLILEFGQHFAMDPITRQEQIMKIWEMAAAAGVSPRTMFKKFGFSDLRSVYDKFKLADDRAKEIIKQIKLTHRQVGITSEFQDHVGIMAYLAEFTNTTDFKDCPSNVQKLIDEHIKSRAQFVARQQQVMAAPAPQG